MEGYTMKLTGTLKDKVDKAETMEEKKAIIAEAGMELTDDELEGVASGFRDKAGWRSAPRCKICGRILVNHKASVEHYKYHKMNPSIDE